MFRHMLPSPLLTRATHRITSQGVSFLLVNVCVPCLKALLAAWSVRVYIYQCLCIIQRSCSPRGLQDL